jgi:hypothetical protein
MIDYIGTKRLVIRKIDRGIAIRRLDGQEELRLTDQEFLDLGMLLAAIEAAVEFDGKYDL